MDNIELIISLPIWLIASIVMFASIPVCFYVLDYKINCTKLIYYYLITGFRWFVWFSIVVFILLPSWGIWFYGLTTFLLYKFGWWTFVLLAPGLILFDSLMNKLKKISFMKRFLNFLHL